LNTSPGLKIGKRGAGGVEWNKDEDSIPREWPSPPGPRVIPYAAWIERDQNVTQLFLDKFMDVIAYL